MMRSTIKLKLCVQDYDVKSVVHIGEDEKLHALKENLPSDETESSVILATIVKLHIRYPITGYYLHNMFLPKR
jgi:hypothetical protein